MNAPDRQLKVIAGEPDRAAYLGSSDCAAILGVGAFGTTPLTVYLKKIGEQPDPIDEKHELFLRRRKRWEGPIVEMLREEFDGEILRVNQRYVDPEYDFLAAEIDFEWADQDGEIQNGEIKTCSPFAFGENQGWGDAGTSDVPIHYAAQIMFGLMITGRQTCIPAAMIGLDDMVFYRIDRDDETIAQIRQACVKFWTENVLKRVPPDPVNLNDCMRISLRMKGRVIEADDDLFENLRSLNGIRESMRAMEGEKNEVMFKIAASILKQWGGDTAPPTENAIITRAAREIASWNLQQTTRVDPKALREAMPEIFRQFSKTTPSRVLRIKKPK